MIEPEEKNQRKSDYIKSDERIYQRNRADPNFWIRRVRRSDKQERVGGK
jgi:hypothetical protein